MKLEITQCNSVITNDILYSEKPFATLKCVGIGEGAVIGACTVVSKNIPAREVLAGNPAFFIRKV
jgi:hypothetical protein